MSDYSAEYHNVRERDEKAEALLRRLAQDRQNLTRLRARTDYVVQPNIVGTQSQALRRAALPEDYQRYPVGEQIVRDPALLKSVMVPTPMKAVPPAKAVSSNPYVQKIQKPPLKNIPSTLYAGGIPTGMPVKKWPTSFRKAYKPTADESILKGLKNLDNMSASLLGKKGR